MPIVAKNWCKIETVGCCFEEKLQSVWNFLPMIVYMIHLYWDLFFPNNNRINQHYQKQINFLSLILLILFGIFAKYIQTLFNNFICFTTHHDNQMSLIFKFSIEFCNQLLYYLNELSILLEFCNHLSYCLNMIWSCEDILQLINFRFYHPIYFHIPCKYFYY